MELVDFIRLDPNAYTANLDLVAKAGQSDSERILLKKRIDRLRDYSPTMFDTLIGVLSRGNQDLESFMSSATVDRTSASKVLSATEAVCRIQGSLAMMITLLDLVLDEQESKKLETPTKIPKIIQRKKKPTKKKPVKKPIKKTKKKPPKKKNRR
jgi:hypothetical protein